MLADPEAGIHYFDPKTNLEVGDSPRHVFEIRVGDHPVAEAELVYMRCPFPFYYVEYIGVKTPFRGQGFGSKLLDHCTGFILNKGKSGLLINGIDPMSPLRDKFYEGHGWVRVMKTNNIYGINLPSGVCDHRLNQARVGLMNWAYKAY